MSSSWAVSRRFGRAAMYRRLQAIWCCEQRFHGNAAAAHKPYLVQPSVYARQLRVYRATEQAYPRARRRYEQVYNSLHPSTNPCTPFHKTTRGTSWELLLAPSGGPSGSPSCIEISILNSSSPAFPRKPSRSGCVREAPGCCTQRPTAGTVGAPPPCRRSQVVS